jgi:hypothetical protein
MTTLLLTEPRQTAPLRLRRTLIRERIRARLCPWRLDQELARGALPDTRGDLSLRAQRLINLRTRQQLALEISSVMGEALNPTHRRHGSVRCCRDAVIGAASLFGDLVDQLMEPGPVDARGVAQVRLLLRDGCGPLYNHQRADRLKPALMTALAALSAAIVAVPPFM